MQYRFTEKEDFSYLSSGNIIKHFKNMPCFPVRVGLELFERAYELIGKDRITVYDPCCGNGFSLTVLGMIMQCRINELYGSDIELYCLEAAECNLSMVNREGLISSVERVKRNETTSDIRRKQLDWDSARLLPFFTNPDMKTELFCHDILASSPEQVCKADYVFADIPYGNLTEWHSDADIGADPVGLLLDNIISVMSEGGIITVCGTKQLRLSDDRFERIDKIRAGKRLIYMLRKKPDFAL